MVNLQTRLPTYDLGPERAHPVSPVPRSDVDRQREQAFHVAECFLVWIVVPTVFWGGLMLWLL